MNLALKHFCPYISAGTYQLEAAQPADCKVGLNSAGEHICSMLPCKAFISIQTFPVLENISLI